MTSPPPPPPATFPVFPALSLAAVVIGGLLAWALVPQFGLAEPGAMAPSATALALGLLFGVAVAAAREVNAVFRAEHLLMVGLVFWVLLDGIQGSYPLDDATPGQLAHAVLAIALFAAMIWAGSAAAASYVRLSWGTMPAQDVGASFLFWAGIVAFVVGNLQPLIGCRLSPGCLADSLFVKRFHEPWLQHGGFGQWDTVLLRLRYFGYLVLPIALAMYRIERRVSWQVFVIGTLAIVFVLFLIGNGQRSTVGTVAGASLLVWTLLGARMTLGRMLGIVLAVAAALVVMQAMIMWRDVGFEQAMRQGLSLHKEGQAGLAVDSNLLYLTYAICVVPDLHPYTDWSGVMHVLLSPFPGSILPESWQIGQINLPGYMGMDLGPRFSWTASVVGDLHIIAGWFGVAVGGLLFGCLAQLASRLLHGPLSVRRTLLYAFAAMTLFMSLRVLDQLVLSAFIVGAFWLLLVVRGLAVGARTTPTAGVHFGRRYEADGAPRGSGAQRRNS